MAYKRFGKASGFGCICLLTVRRSPLIFFRCVEMQRNSSRLTRQLWEKWLTFLNHLQDDPRVAQLMRTRLGQHLSGRPFLALTLLLFSAMAALPVGLFLMFALVTIVISAVGFVFFEVFLLLVGGLTLLSVLSGIALFSLLVSVIVSTLLFTIPNLLKHYYPRQTKEKQREDETPAPKEAQ
ncbi:lipid droplet assembly factor 1 isoform X2 [Kryptolebias marmoratus]|uniref:Transmembrane protein 159 n=1 Tax=Kryptolebias marmoratus TaxID=37003 RepID=A0A3Q3B6J5_KRYMA|nr:lipid droplet assembly factor 1 isoform X2 [Kryptolebias marmoratus]